MRAKAAPQDRPQPAEPYTAPRVTVAVPSPFTSLRSRLARAGDFGRRKSSALRGVPPLHDLLELTARIGYGARGFVYLSVGLLTLLGAVDFAGDAVSARGALAWLADTPFGRLWMMAVGIGLCAFVMWRVLQSVFDADHQGTSLEGLSHRMAQAFSGSSYAILAFTAFHFMARKPETTKAADVEASRERAQTVMSLPLGDEILMAAGAALFTLGLVTIRRAWHEDFTEYLACSAKTSRRVAPLARAGYVARGLAYLPLAILIILAGWNSRSSQVSSFGSALDAVERQPGGAWVLAAAALGFMAFGVFSFIEARFRRIRPPRDLNPL